MKNQFNHLIEEGLRIVDEDGFPFESEEQNAEAWQAEIDGVNDSYEGCHDNEDAMEMSAQHFCRRADLRRYDKKKRFVHRSRGNDYSWMDPAGGTHSWDEVDPAAMYI